jgi:hypothetical protein
MNDFDFGGGTQIIAGDFVVNPSVERHMEMLLLTNKGGIRHAPLAGVGLLRYVNGPQNNNWKSSLRRELRLQMEADGIKADLSQGELLIENIAYQ